MGRWAYPPVSQSPSAQRRGRAAERLRELPSLQDESGVSASIGVAQWQPPMTTDELLAACDVALLRSKRQGKGRVTSAAQTVR